LPRSVAKGFRDETSRFLLLFPFLIDLLLNTEQLGVVDTLVTELASQGDAIGSSVIGKVMFLSISTSETLGELAVDAAHPYISSVTMIASSPDWFSGFYDFDARDTSTNTWYGEFLIETYPWDAGTETGDTYSFSNPAESSPHDIMRFTIDTVPATTRVFLSSDGSTVLPVAQWQCLLVGMPMSPTPSPIVVSMPTVGVSASGITNSTASRAVSNRRQVRRCWTLPFVVFLVVLM
jgi:Spondin_N